MGIVLVDCPRVITSIAINNEVTINTSQLTTLLSQLDPHRPYEKARMSGSAASNEKVNRSSRACRESRVIQDEAPVTSQADQPVCFTRLPVNCRKHKVSDSPTSQNSGCRYLIVTS
jgi:hypothetical protein